MKSRTLHVRVTDAEYARIVEGASQHGSNMSNYIRECMGMKPLSFGRPSSKKKNQEGKLSTAREALATAEAKQGLR